MTDGSAEQFLVQQIIRILHEYQVWIDKSVLRLTVWHLEARRVMLNCSARDRFGYPYLTRMMDFFLARLNAAKLDVLYNQC